MLKKVLIFLSISLLFGSVVPNLAKSTEEVTGEEELFVKEESKKDVEFKKGFEVTLGFEFDWIQAYGFSEQDLAMRNEAYEGRLRPRATYLFSENSMIYITIPYVCKYTFVGYTYFLDEKWEFVTGLGDIRGGISYQLLSERWRPVNVLAGVEVISNTARVYSGEGVPLGNGYWNIACGVGISKTVDPRGMLLASIGYVYRFEKAGRWVLVREKDDLVRKRLRYKPRDMKLYNLGAVSPIGKKKLWGVEFQHSSGIKAKGKYTTESRLGITLKEVKNGELIDIGFFGIGWIGEWEEDSDYWLLTLTSPLRLKIFGVSF